jgi:hypothetical protein
MKKEIYANESSRYAKRTKSAIFVFLYIFVYRRIKDQFFACKHLFLI